MILTVLDLLPADTWHTLPSYQVLLLKEHQGTKGRRPAGGSWEVALLSLVLGPYRLGWEWQAVCHEGLLSGAQDYMFCLTARPFFIERIVAVFDAEMGWKIPSSLSASPPHSGQLRDPLSPAGNLVSTHCGEMLGEQVSRQNRFLMYPSLKNTSFSN